jgi:hypothetical protein
VIFVRVIGSKDNYVGGQIVGVSGQLIYIKLFLTMLLIEKNLNYFVMQNT